MVAVTLHEKSYKEKKSKHSKYRSPSGRIPFDSKGERKGSYPPFLPSDVLHKGLPYPAQFLSPLQSTAPRFLTWEAAALAHPAAGLQEPSVTSEEHTSLGTPQPRSCLGAQHATPKPPADQDSVCLLRCQALLLLHVTYFCLLHPNTAPSRFQLHGKASSDAVLLSCQHLNS